MNELCVYMYIYDYDELEGLKMKGHLVGDTSEFKNGGGYPSLFMDVPSILLTNNHSSAYILL